MTAFTGPIKDVCLGIYDGPHATPKESDTGPIFLGIKNVTTDGRLDFSEIRHVSEQEFPRWTRRVTPKKGDIVFSYEATLHLYALIPEGFHGCLGRRMALVRPDPSKVVPRYLHYYFLSPAWKAMMMSNVITGATVDRIPLTRFPDFPVRIPVLAEQQRISDILSPYDDLIENNRRRISLLEESARLLYREWFVYLRFPGHEHTKVVNGVPHGWERKPLGDSIKTASGGTPSRKKPEFYGEGVAWVKTKELNDGFIFDTEEQITQIGLENSSAKLFPKGTVLLAMYGATIGATAILGKAATTNQACCALLVAERKGLGYYSFLWLRDIKDVLVGMGMGAAQPNLSQDIIRKIDFLMPPDLLLSEFDDYIGDSFKQIATLTQKNEKLREARDLLLPRLMNGEIQV